MTSAALAAQRAPDWPDAFGTSGRDPSPACGSFDNLAGEECRSSSDEAPQPPGCDAEHDADGDDRREPGQVPLGHDLNVAAAGAAGR